MIAFFGAGSKKAVSKEINVDVLKMASSKLMGKAAVEWLCLSFTYSLLSVNASRAALTPFFFLKV